VAAGARRLASPPQKEAITLPRIRTGTRSFARRKYKDFPPPVQGCRRSYQRLRQQRRRGGQSRSAAKVGAARRNGQLSRNEDLQDKLCAAGWDLAVFDEAHKLAAHYFGSKLEKTARFRFAEKLGATTQHLLLMTATPHNGKEEDFQLFLSLLDSGRPAL
jgi:hypothetical protein